MADFTALKNSIRNYIKQNGNAEITGEVLQNILISMVVSMGDGAINGIADGLANEGNARTNADGLLQNAINSISTALGDGYTYAGIATPATTPTSGRVFYLALQAGTYTNFGGIVVTQGINILKNNDGTWQLDNVIGIDDIPTAGSPNLVKSGGAFANMGAFDISDYNKSGSTLATYADLTAALAALPSEYQKGGMSVKFIQSSDNKYVQCRLMSDSFNTTVANWQGVDDEPTAGSENLVKSGGAERKISQLGQYIDNSEWVQVVTDSEDKILYGVKTDGKFYFGDGCPPQVVAYVTARLEELEGDFTTLLNLKVDNEKVIGGGTILCFGDSITEFKYNNKGWCEYLADLSGLDVVRGAFGGAHIVSRGEPVMNPTTEGQARSCLDIRNLVESWVNNDYTIIDNCVAWLVEHDGRTNYPAIVQNLKDNPVENVDIVTILAGTNDFRSESGNNEGVSDTLKEIYNIILTANPKIKVYFFTPLVRYWDNIRDDAHWSDTSTRQDGLTLADFVDVLIKATNEAHISVCDLYRTLGWNQSNFSNYFPDDDGTHPLKGFNDLAKRIYNFLVGKGGSVLDFTKVEKEKGKSLIDADFASSQEVVEDSEYIQMTEDSENKLLEGINADGTKVIKIPLEVQGVRHEVVDSNDYIQVTTDSEGRIIEGTRKDGKKVFFCGIEGVGDTNPSIINIPLLDANFASPVPVTIIGTKGDENAKYEFALPLSDEAFNIRFKFRVTENLLNQNKTAVLAKLGAAALVTAKGESLVQKTTQAEYESQQKTNYWPCLAGGVRFNNSLTYDEYNPHIGLLAFSIKYTGSEDTATAENTGSSFILKIGSTTHEFSYTTYPSVSELYEALKLIADIEVDYRELNNRNCVELAKFGESKLRSTMYTGITGAVDAPIVEYVDAAPFMVPYAVDETWHNVEVAKIGEIIYCSCDGILTEVSAILGETTSLVLGGECSVFFKDLQISTKSSDDAEISGGVLISSFNPYIIVYEGHGMDKVPSAEATSSGNMNTTTDRLQYVFTTLKEKGYSPVSIYDIAEFYNGNKTLPKRCYTLIFDDFRFENVMDIENREVFTRFGVKPALAIISDRFSSVDIYHDGVVITPEQAVSICKIFNFDLVSHTRNHRANDAVKPSEMLDELISDNYNGEIYGVDGSILVFPYGTTSPYLFIAMNWLGYKLGINVWGGSYNAKDNLYRSKYNLIRYEIGMRMSLDTILTGIK